MSAQYRYFLSDLATRGRKTGDRRRGAGQAVVDLHDRSWIMRTNGWTSAVRDEQCPVSGLQRDAEWPTSSVGVIELGNLIHYAAGGHLESGAAIAPKRTSQFSGPVEVAVAGLD